MIVLLGPQHQRPTLGAAVAALGIEGPIATVTAGWQEREQEDQELAAQLGGRVARLDLHRRGEQVFEQDPELAAAYRLRQDRLRQARDCYRIRLEHAVAAANVITRRNTDPALLADEARVSLEAVRRFDTEYLRRCRELHTEFAERWRPQQRDAVARQRRGIGTLLQGTAALAIAGGHVAVLRNRLELFGVAGLIGERPVFAWSAGAMAIAETIVLFHESPPLGPGISEILDSGLGLCPGVVPLPDPQRRLRLDDRERVAQLAGRYAPALCLALGHGAQLVFDRGRWSGQQVQRLAASGEVLSDYGLAA